MIFAHTDQLVVDGKKTHTLRMVREGDQLGLWDGKPAVFSGIWDPQLGRARPRHAGEVSELHAVRWAVGREYAVQPKYYAPARARIVVTSLARIEDPTAIGLELVKREGFESAEPFLKVWHEMHGKKIKPAWGIGFKVLWVRRYHG